MIQFVVHNLKGEVPENFRELNNHHIADFENLTSEERKELKFKYPQGYFRLSVWEEGGGDFNTGSARIVCGVNGEKLKPSRTRRRGWLANDKHALFTGNSLCYIDVTLENKEFSFKIYVASIKPKIGILEEELIWVGDNRDLQALKNYEYFRDGDTLTAEQLKNFLPALEAAVKKALEYRCTFPMYVLKENEPEDEDY